MSVVANYAGQTVILILQHPAAIGDELVAAIRFKLL
jgi:hypothetical protein